MGEPSKLFLARRSAIWRDGWRYGDYEQFVCPRDGETQCARVLLWLPFGWRLMWAVGPLNRGDRRVLFGDRPHD